MPRTPPGHGNAVRRRPKDRKAQIARASAEAFSALGYYGVSMETIASRVGVSAPALYRHYSSKYELFRDAVLSLSRQLLDATAFADEAADDDPQRLLRRLVAALTDTALMNRESGGLYRWEGRLLRGDDQTTLNAHVRIVHRRIQRPLSDLRPQLTSRQRWTLSTSVLSVIGSIVDHRAKLPAAQIRALLDELAVTVLAADLPEPLETTEPGLEPAEARTESRTEALLDASMVLFNSRGYHDTTMEQIAAAVGIPTSGIYRHFAGKADILAAAFERAADRLSAELTSITTTVTDCEEALATVIDAYVARSFGHPELDYVYYAERLNMSLARQEMLRRRQRSTVGAWAQLVVSTRPQWTVAQARFAVHAAMALVIDLGRLMNYRNSAANRAVVTDVLYLTLLGRYRLRTPLPIR